MLVFIITTYILSCYIFSAHITKYFILTMRLVIYSEKEFQGKSFGTLRTPNGAFQLIPTTSLTSRTAKNLKNWLSLCYSSSFRFRYLIRFLLSISHNDDHFPSNNIDIYALRSRSHEHIYGVLIENILKVTRRTPNRCLLTLNSWFGTSFWIKNIRHRAKFIRFGLIIAIFFGFLLTLDRIFYFFQQVLFCLLTAQPKSISYIKSNT